MAVAAALFISGCEDNTNDSPLNKADPVSPLGLNPASVELGLGITYAVFTASGGVPPYSWSVSDSTLGSVPASTAGTITYTRSGATIGANVIFVSDANGWSAQSIVSQTASTNSVTQ